MSVASVTDGLIVEMLPALSVVNERLPSVDRQSGTQWQMIPSTTERLYSRSWGNTQNYPEFVITYENMRFKGLSPYPTMSAHCFSKGMIIDVWV